MPSGKKVRALITANDVIHAWWIPAFGTKKDAIPGYINELWFNVDEGKEGLYRGQCAELCGKDHAFMPIVVEVVTAQEFDNWIESGGKSYEPLSLNEKATDNKKQIVESEATLKEALGTQVSSNQAEADVTNVVSQVTQKVVNVIVPVANAQEADSPTKDDLLAIGETVYAKTCAACHGAQGAGIPGVFPAIAGSSVVNGPVDSHIDTVMFGKRGTAMAAFARQLSAEEIAGVITYQRNSFGNTAGDVVLPSAISAKNN